MDQSYDEGKRDGRLDSHDRLLDQLRSDIATIVALVTSLKLETQRLGDNAKASAEATIKLAEAVNAEKINARENLAAQVDASDRESDLASDKFTRRDKMVGLGIAGASSIATVYLGLHR